MVLIPELNNESLMGKTLEGMINSLVDALFTASEVAASSFEANEKANLRQLDGNRMSAMRDRKMRKALQVLPSIFRGHAPPGSLQLSEMLFVTLSVSTGAAPPSCAFLYMDNSNNQVRSTGANNSYVAVKEVAPTSRSGLQQEATLQARVCHKPSFAFIFGVNLDVAAPILVQELISCKAGPGVTAMTLLTAKNDPAMLLLKTYHFVEILVEVAKGLAYLHTARILHNDLKTINPEQEVNDLPSVRTISSLYRDQAAE
uniref:Protein kinase domain-containing protein n=1 Tax=Branchiostoma floridae TaxID=7739 RepID=C3ZUL7_BRAFL|eukprot:XP_002587718.1 hypothetical protein BRAFLDRAFT_94622 [Branchiostoma floridae]